MRPCAKCDRPASARGMCNHHYQMARKLNLLEPAERMAPRKTQGVALLAQKGENPECVDCQDTPLFGGMRCMDCFKARCDSKRDTIPHEFAEPATYGTYARGCRCRQCKDACATVKRRSRAKTAA
jgi:hypothetical protein